eukprot:TRINITY_DN1929_c0_g4_i1.p1 TRINITY_DN1929_c0_g4~~TRINITY_DN1929_c0_g4_i1.p1  ORF type:complete len:988 (-),score=190.70 TRINITY_DN1929_c0_g4_i1:225-3188(-)
MACKMQMLLTVLVALVFNGDVHAQGTLQNASLNAVGLGSCNCTCPQGTNPASFCAEAPETDLKFVLIAGLCAFIWSVVYSVCIFIHCRRPKEPKVQKEVIVSTCESEIQTTPQLFAELIRGPQKPVDLVCCLDSSFSVGAKCFQKSVDFLVQVVQELEMPTSRVGVVSFHHQFREVSPMTGAQAELLQHLSKLSFDPGETKLAPPLRHANSMLRGTANDSKKTDRKKVILVVTDGDPNDLTEASIEADKLKNQGVLLLFVQVGDAANGDVIASLASSPRERCVFRISNFDVLQATTSDVLREVVRVSQVVRQAKCCLNLKDYEVVEDITAVDGSHVMVPGWESEGLDVWTWKPSRDSEPIQDPKAIPWERASPKLCFMASPQVELPELELPKQNFPDILLEVPDQQVLMEPAASPGMVLEQPSPSVSDPVPALASVSSPPTPIPAPSLAPVVMPVPAPNPVPLPTQSFDHQFSFAYQSSVPRVIQGQTCEMSTQTRKVDVRALSTQTQVEARALSTQTQSDMRASSTQTDEEKEESPAPLEPTPVQTLSESGVQTLPLVKVCLEPWRQSPLDLVVCIDSSASFCLARRPAQSPLQHRGAAKGDGAVDRSIWVESGTFGRAKFFVEQLATAVHMPEVRLGLLRFEDVQDVICELTGQPELFIPRLREMEPSPGETKVAPPLWQALSMLSGSVDRSGSAGIASSTTSVAKAVLVITDGDPNDREEAAEAAAALGMSGIQVLFVRILKESEGGRSGGRGCTHLQALAVPRQQLASHVMPTAGGALEQKGLLEVEDSTEALTRLVPEVLQQFIYVQQRVARARCTLPLHPYEVVSSSELDAMTSGLECMLPVSSDTLPDGSPVILDPMLLSWDPLHLGHMHKVESYVERESKVLIDQREPQQEPEQESQQEPSERGVSRTRQKESKTSAQQKETQEQQQQLQPQHLQVDVCSQEANASSGIAHVLEPSEIALQDFKHRLHEAKLRAVGSLR